MHVMAYSLCSYVWSSSNVLTRYCQKVLAFESATMCQYLKFLSCLLSPFASLKYFHAITYYSLKSSHATPSFLEILSCHTLLVLNPLMPHPVSFKSSHATTCLLEILSCYHMLAFELQLCHLVLAFERLSCFHVLASKTLSCTTCCHFNSGPATTCQHLKPCPAPCFVI
jgi:hypothetical protein